LSGGFIVKNQNFSDTPPELDGVSKMKSILEKICEYFIDRQKTQQCFSSFIANDVRIEGWIKGEMLFLLQKLKADGYIANFEAEAILYEANPAQPVNTTDDDKDNRTSDDTEVSPGGGIATRKRIDFIIEKGETQFLCELKSLSVIATETPRTPAFYFQDDKVGVIADLKKLDQDYRKNKYAIAFIYPGLSYTYSSNHKKSKLRNSSVKTLFGEALNDASSSGLDHWNITAPILQNEESGEFSLAMWTCGTTH
jgi:hypothetical protein